MGLLKFGYKKATVNEALIITGSKLGKEGDPGIYVKAGRMMRIVRGGSVFVTPFQRAERINLNSMQIKLTTPRIVTTEGVPLRVWATATVKIGDELPAIVSYAEQFLSKSREHIVDELRNILEGNLRTIVAKLTVIEVNNGREQFMNRVKDAAQKELAKMGLLIVSLVLDDVRDDDDENGYLAHLGAKTIADSKRNIEIARSNAQLEVAKKVTENQRYEQMTANTAAIALDESLKMRELKAAQNELDLEMQRIEKAEQVRLKEIELEKKIKIAQIEAAEQAHERALLIKEAERQVCEQDELIRAQNERIRAQAQAEVELIHARTEIKVIEARAKANIAAIEAQGKAEAEAIRLKGRAEAEAIAKRAEALKHYGNAAVLEMVLKVLPELARALSEPLSNIDEVKVIGGGHADEGRALQQFASTPVHMLTLMQSFLKEATGVDVKELIEAQTVSGRNSAADKKETLRSKQETTLSNDEPTNGEAKSPAKSTSRASKRQSE